MPSLYTPQQRAHISQFVGFTSAKDSVAAKHLKSHGWNVEQAIDAKPKMLTAEDQWKIIQEKERRTGGGRRKKKKTLVEQFRDMGGFNDDLDSEQAVTNELERTDTRPPLQYSDGSVSECELSSGESSFWETRKRLFHSWIFQANRSSSWIEEKDLPLFFRFALRRPIMDERSFQATLQFLDLHLEMRMGDVRRPNTYPIGRSRQLMFGIDVDRERDKHVSSKLQHVLPRGGAGKMDSVRNEATRMTQQDDEDMQQLLRRQLWAVYEHVQNGSVPLETATWHYRDAFSREELDDEALVLCLEQFGIPTDHIPSSERDARLGSAHSPFSGGSESFREDLIPDEKDGRIIQELRNYIGLYRDGILQEPEVIPMIQHSLQGPGLEMSVISDILTDLDKDEETAALLMWEDSYKTSSSSSSSSSEVEDDKSNKDQPNPFRSGMALHSLANEGKDHDSAATSPVAGSKSHDGLATEIMSYREDSKKNEPEQSELTTIDQRLMPPPAIPFRKRPTPSHVDDPKISMRPPGTPRPKPESLASATEEPSNQVDNKSGRELPPDGANVGRRRLSSPEDGMTTGIWGLLMPTKEARTIAHKLKLPQDTIDEKVRSISPRRTRRMTASHAKEIVTFPKSKRKASMVLHGDAPPKSPKHGHHLDLFAREGENHLSFVLSHYGPDDFHPDTCTRCLRLPCECVFVSSPHSRSDPGCLRCLQQLCMCDRLSLPDGADPTAPPVGNLSFDGPKAKFPDRTRPEPRKQSVTMISYLARVLDKEDVLASIKQLKRLPQADTTIADVKAIMYHIRRGEMDDDVDYHISGDDDREFARILRDLVKSSPILTEFWHKLDARSENSSTTSVDESHHGVENGLEVVSSLPNSSPGHEYVLDPPSNSVASAAAFPATQSSVANGPVVQANKPLAEHSPPYLTTSTPVVNPSVRYLEPSSYIEDVIPPSCSQADTIPDSSAAGDPSRAKTHSASPAGGESSTAGGHPPTAEILSDSPAGSPPSSTADPSEQVSDRPVEVEGDTDCHTFGTPLTRQPSSNSRDTDNSEDETRSPPSPRLGARALRRSVSPPSHRTGAMQLPTGTPPPPPRPKSKDLPRSIPKATPRLGSKDSTKEMNATAQSCLKTPGTDSLPVWPPQPKLPIKAGKEWMGMTPKKALEHAKEEAFNQRKSLNFYLDERRAVRTRIKDENAFANSVWLNHSFFQSSGSSGTAITPALNKLFDKYRDDASEEPDKIGIEGSMRYLTDLGVKLDEVVVLAILTELGAPTMGEFTRDGFVNGWQNHRAETLSKQQGQIASFRRSLAMTPDFFKRVYKQTFLIARLPGQKIVPLETALEYWRLLFTPPSLSWNTASTPWLTLWLDYLEAEWKKSISKDMWDQTGVFAMKSLEDESMSWWSEDGAWPGVLDEFVFYVRQKREKKGDAAGGAESEMEIG